VEPQMNTDKHRLFMLTAYVYRFMQAEALRLSAILRPSVFICGFYLKLINSRS
jgi:hypothetical protein